MGVLNLDRTPSLAEEDIVIFNDSVGRFFDEKAPESRVAKWREDGMVERAFWTESAEAGLSCLSIPEEYGGMGGDYRHEAILMEQLGAKGVDGFGLSLHNAIVAHYILKYGTEEQKQRWLPKMASCELISAIAMTEPGAGSDLQGVRTTAKKDGNHYVISGSKTYITNGQNADLIIVVAKTDPDKGAKGTSLILVEAGTEGFARGRNLDKIGQHSADTSELFFNDVRVPMTNCLGEENKGFIYLMSQLPQERLGIAISAQAGAQRAYDEAVKFTKDRKAFGKTVFDFQNTRFTLASLKTELQVGWAHIDWGLKRLLEHRLTAAEASAAKLWHTEMQGRVVDAALQLHGGAGYMNEYPIARLWRDARVQRIYGGTSEIMREVISRTI